MEEYSSKKKANIPASIEMMPEPHIKSLADGEENATDLTDREVIKAAFFYFTTFKGLLVDLIFTFRERNESMEFFRSRTTKDAFLVVEAELNFFYDVLYTKAAVVHCRTGYIFRAISLGSVITAFALFYVLNKHGFHEYDIKITYTLLLGAVGLEFVALSMLIFTDWTILGRSVKYHRIRNAFIKFLLKFKSVGSPFELCILHARWSKSVFQYNLIDSRLRRWPKWIEKLFDCISLGEIFDDLKSGRRKPYSDKLGALIFNELKQKSSAAVDTEHIKEMCAARGKWALENTKTGEDYKPLLPFVHEVDYGESLILWHIATDLCDNADTDEMAGIGQIRFRDTCAEMDKFIDGTKLNDSISDGTKPNDSISEGSKPYGNISHKNISGGSKTKTRKESACGSLLSVLTDAEVRPVDVKGGRSKSVLFDACILAKILLRIDKVNRWKIMSVVWVELLGYPAIHCRPYNHAQQLSKGGELVTFVWLLMGKLAAESAKDEAPSQIPLRISW
ncbi:hypothetical protein NL676_005173 [Syzygium grande]|nr:hypothetical protein NL676_005173 [Syzygium grande]